MKHYLIMAGIALGVSMVITYLNNHGKLVFLLPKPPKAEGSK